MSRPVTLFCSYSKTEDLTTNFCMVLLKMLYVENRKFFAEALSALVGKPLPDEEGVVEFAQQKRLDASVPDGLIQCTAYTIFIETKTDERFRGSQLDEHLAELNKPPGFKALIALSNFEKDDEANLFQAIRQKCTANRYAVEVNRVSFWDFLVALNPERMPNCFRYAHDEFQAFLRTEGFLPKWERELRAMSCPEPCDGVLSANAYIDGRIWEDFRCKYLGWYDGDYVTKIAAVEARLDIEDEQRACVRWQNLGYTEYGDDLIRRARAETSQHWPGQFPARVFLLGTAFRTKFTAVAIERPVACKLFDVGSLNTSSAESLAGALMGKVRSNGSSWEEESLWKDCAPRARVVQ